MNYMVMCGNPIDGLRFIGPFECREDAYSHADGIAAVILDWWIVELESPEELS